MKTLQGKIALVTGGSRSLGFAVAKALIAQGAVVIITARNETALECAQNELGESAVAVQLDLRDCGSVRKVFEIIQARFGRLDIVVNNAAVGCLHRIDQASDEELHAQVETNFLGVIYTIREAVPLMRRSGGGDIINLSSESVRHPFPMLGVYAATKAAVECLADGLRDELRPDNIRIATLRCGNIGEGSGFGDNWDAGVKDDAYKLWAQTGHLAFAGQPMTSTVVADTLISMVCTPRSAGLDIVEVRGR